MKVLTEGSMVEYLPVGSQEAPQTIFGQKKFQPQSLKSHSQPSVQCIFVFHFFIQRANGAASPPGDRVWGADD